MNITIYTIANSPFCDSLREYLNTNGLVFEEKNVEDNRTYLSEMLAISSNFAGVPFTVITKPDGSSIHLHGFTQSEFDTALTPAQPTEVSNTTPPPTSMSS